MSSSAQKPPRSVSSQSSHHSSIEPRGAPEFNREYARQLSTARKSRSASKGQRRGGDDSSVASSTGNSPASRSPPPAQSTSSGNVSTSRFRPLGSLFASAKEMSASTPGRTPSGATAAGGSDTPRVPMTQRPPLAPSTPSMLNRAGGAAGASPTATPPPPPAELADNRVTPSPSGRDDKEAETVVSVVRVVQIVLLVWLVMFLVFCGVALFTSEDAAYRPYYFSLTRAPVRELNASANAYTPHGVDRMVPQVCRQLALRVRNCGRLVSSAFMSGGQLQVLGMVLSDIADGVVLALRWVYDRLIAPTTELLGRQGNRVWSAVTSAFVRADGGLTFNVSNALRPVAQSMNFMLVDPSKAVYETTLSFFVSGANALRYMYYTFVSHGSGTSPFNTSTLHRATAADAHPSSTAHANPVSSLKSLGSRWWDAGRNATRALLGRGDTAARRTWFSRGSESVHNRTPSQPVTFSFRAHYQRRLDGDMWRDILAVDAAHVERLVAHEIKTALGLRNTASVTNVKLRVGSLVVDADVTQETTATPGRSGKNADTLSKRERGVAQKETENRAKAILQKWPFASVMDFYRERSEELQAAQAQQRLAMEQREKQRASEVAANAALVADECTCLRAATAASVKNCKPPPSHLADLCSDLVSRATTSAQKQCADKLSSINTENDKTMRQKHDAHTHALAESQKKCDSQLQKAQKATSDAQADAKAALDRCEAAAKQQQDACRKDIEKAQHDAVAAAAAGGEKSLAEAMAAAQAELASAKKTCESRVAAETSRCQVAHEKAEKQCAADQTAAVQAAKHQCDSQLQKAQKATSDAQANAKAALDRCEAAAKQQQDACRKDIEKAQHDAVAAAAAGGEKSLAEAMAAAQAELASAKKTCESRVAAETSRCQVAHEKAEKQCAADQTAAAQAAKRECEAFHARAKEKESTRVSESAARELEAALANATQACSQQLAAQKAAATTTTLEAAQACSAIQEQLKDTQADVARCVSEKEASDARLASESAGWAAEKEALVRDAKEQQVQIHMASQRTMDATAAAQQEACEARVEEAVTAALGSQLNQQHDTCSEQLQQIRATLNASCASMVANAVHAEKSSAAQSTAQQLAEQRVALQSKALQQSHRQYLNACEAACTGQVGKGAALDCTARMQQLTRSTPTLLSNETTLFPPVLLDNHSGVSPQAPVCGLAWSDAVQLSRATTTATATTPNTCGRRSWRRVGLTVLVVAGSGAATIFSCRVALRQHRTAVLLRDEVRQLKKQVASLESEQTRHRNSSSSTSRAETPDHITSQQVSPVKAPAEQQELRWCQRPLESVVADHFETMTAWHFTCCNLLWMSASGTMIAGGGSARGAFGDADLTPPPAWRNWASAAPRTTTPDDDEEAADHPPMPREATAPSTPTQAPIAVPTAAGAAPPGSLSPVASHLERRVVRGYYYMLESYYVDLLESVMNRELIEHQLEEMEDVASKQMNLLQTQSNAVERLQDEVGASANNLATARKQHQAECAAYQQQIAKQKAAPLKEMEALRAELEKAQQEARQATQMRNLQAEMVAVLEEQLNRVTNALQESQGAPGASTGGELAMQTAPTATTSSRSGATPRMLRGSENRREYRELNWRDTDHAEP